MLASGISVRGFIVLTKPAHYLRTAVLTCLVMAWPQLVAAQEQATAVPAQVKVSSTVPVELDDPLRVWFKEQDSVLDDILVRLSRIEALVRDIHRLVQQFQIPAAPAAAIAQAAPTPDTVPAASKLEATMDIPALLENRDVQLAGAGLLLLLLLLLWSHRRKAARLRELQTGEVKPMAAAMPPPAPPQPAAAISNPAPTAEPLTDLSFSEQTKVIPPAITSHDNGTAQSSDQALELAEIMLAMGLGQGAAQTLTEQIQKEPKPALRNWLKLLEIYRQNGQQDEFERSAEELRQVFNVLPEDWQVQSEMQRSIEDYPHIAVRLSELWGKPACASYLGNLINDNRDGVRTGFPQSVAEELLLLMAMLNDEGTVEQAAAAIKAGKRA
jgi:hypothetical protein